jgi:DNA-binding MarR family transcriptional regulator
MSRKTRQSVKKEHFIDDYLAYLLARASQSVSNEFRSSLSSAGVSVIEWRVLSTLYDHPQISVGKLSDIVLCKQPTLSKAIDRMESKGWITRTLNNQDRRMISVTIDEAGMKIIQSLLSESMDLERSELDGFDEKEIDDLKKILRKLIDHCSDMKAVAKSRKIA